MNYYTDILIHNCLNCNKLNFMFFDSVVKKLN